MRQSNPACTCNETGTWTDYKWCFVVPSTAVAGNLSWAVCWSREVAYGKFRAPNDHPPPIPSSLKGQVRSKWISVLSLSTPNHYVLQKELYQNFRYFQSYLHLKFNIFNRRDIMTSSYPSYIEKYWLFWYSSFVNTSYSIPYNISKIMFLTLLAL